MKKIKKLNQIEIDLLLCKWLNLDMDDVTVLNYIYYLEETQNFDIDKDLILSKLKMSGLQISKILIGLRDRDIITINADEKITVDHWYDSIYRLFNKSTGGFE